MGLDHVFFDIAVFDLVVRGDPRTSLAAVRTSDRGKVLASVAIEGADFETLATNVHDAVVGPFSAPYVVVTDGDKRGPMKRACARCKREELFARRRWIDFDQFVWPLGLCDQISNSTLATVGKTFAVKRSHEGSVAGDVAFLAETYWEVARRYRAGLTAEAFVRDAGGSTLAVVRRMIGV